MLFIVSEVELRPAPTDVEAHADAKPRVTIERAGGVKCERCWRYVPAVSSEPDLGRPVRALPGRTGRGHPWMTSSRQATRASRRSRPRRRLEIWLPVVIVALDQVTKAMVRRTLPLHESVTVIPGFLDFTHVRNTGAAFGILNGVGLSVQDRAASPLIAMAALVGVGVYAASLAHAPAARPDRAGAHHRRRGRQPHRPGDCRARSSISSMSTGGRIISGRSTSPTRRSRSAWPS